jgi:hypothetical protein
MSIEWNQQVEEGFHYNSIEGPSKGLNKMVCFCLLRDLFQTSSQVD